MEHMNKVKYEEGGDAGGDQNFIALRECTLTVLQCVHHPGKSPNSL